MSFPRTLLFHLSPLHNLYRIRECGIQISLDARGKGRIWLAEHRLLRQIAEHLCRRDKKSYEVFTVFQIHKSQLMDALKQSGRPGIWFVDRDIESRCVTELCHMECDAIGARYNDIVPSQLRS